MKLKNRDSIDDKNNNDDDDDDDNDDKNNYDGNNYDNYNNNNNNNNDNKNNNNNDNKNNDKNNNNNNNYIKLPVVKLDLESGMCDSILAGIQHQPGKDKICTYQVLTMILYQKDVFFNFFYFDHQLLIYSCLFRTKFI